ncbi:MAG TPA: sugar phosphate isomerase/epimerase [Pirellulales bacterium]|nr:sugar phosphate isomerase/epimerase [Pirellulales bacterium]
MQLGFVTAILPDLGFADVLKFAAEEQFDCVEVMCWPVGKAERKFAGVTHIDASEFTQAEADDVNALCQKHGVAMSGLGYYPNILSADAEEGRVATAHLKKVISAARLLGLSNVNTFIGADHRRNADENFELFRKTWPDLIKFAEDHDMRIGIENCPMLFTWDEWPAGKNMAYSPAVWRRMFEAIPSRHFGLNYDPSHMVLQMMDYLRPIYEFRDRLFHTHAKDMKIDRQKLDDRGILGLGWSTPKIPGLGSIDWAAWISSLTDVGYRGPVSIEVEDDSFRDSLEARKRSLRISRNVLRPLIG